MGRRKHPYEYRDKLSWPRTLILVGVACLLCYCIYIASKQKMEASAAPAPMGCVPPASELMRVASHSPGEFIDYGYFSIDFNPEMHIPNWVAWELTRDKTSGEEPRGKFQSDPSVSGCSSTTDYTGSGYDRGHMAPAADMKWHPDAMRSCFYMTNICPQAHSLNGGTWKKLEEKCRIWAKADSSIIIVCGPVLDPQPDEFIGANAVAVPQRFFKVICSPYANPPRAIGFIMPNGKIAGGLQAAAVSVDSVESATGLDFFSALPDSIENTIEAECRFHYWSTIKPQ